MFVKSVMIPKHKCYVVSVEESLKKVLDVLEHHKIDGVPVLSNGKYAGTISRFSIYRHYFESGMEKNVFLNEVKAGEVASEQGTYVTEKDVFESALVLLQDAPILPVAGEDREFLGLITRFDVLDHFKSAFGMNTKGIRIAFSSVETEGRIARLGDIIQQHSESVISLVTFDETDKLLRRIVLKLEKRDNMNKFISKLEKSGFRILDIHEDE
ncbi:CBS domain-containing protein [Rossellomorea marisflavi]